MRVLDIVKLLILATLWGSSFLFMRIAAPQIGPIWLIEFRVLLASLILLPILVRAGLWYEIRRNWMPMVFVGGLGSAIPYSLMAFSSISLPAGFTSILNATAPLFGTVIAWVWFQEKLSIARIFGFVLGFIGVMVLVGWKELAATPVFLMAVSAGLLAAFMYAIVAPYIKQKLAGVSALAIATGSQFSAALILLPVMPFTIPNQPPTIMVIFSIVSLALLSSVFAHLLYFQLIENIGSTQALTVTYLIPIFAMLWGAIFLGEAITVSMMLGGSLILLGTAIANDIFATD
jgi:drug/metabolite transporter (DMT)-like permease